MIRTISLFLLAVAPLSAATAQPAAGESSAAEQSARQPSEAQSEQGQRAERPAERRICRRIETTGARTGAQRVCMTAEEWRRADY